MKPPATRCPNIAMSTAGIEYRQSRLHCDEAPLDEVAQRFGTPSYVYSGRSIVRNYRAYTQALQALDHTIHYSVKANSSLGVLALLVREDAGFDIVSGGELFRVLKAGGDPSRVVFSGVGKTVEEMEYALRSGVGCFNCESKDEVRLLNEMAGRLDLTPIVALRVNPDIDADTHPYIATGLRDHKFGVALAEAEAIYRDHRSYPHLRFEAISCHIGSQIFDTAVFVAALDTLVALAGRLRSAGLPIRELDLGGGLGVAYNESHSPPSIEDYARALVKTLQGKDLRLMLEPGRSIVGQAGVLLTRVLYRKPGTGKEFIVVDAAMNDLIRPSLYQSYHEILPVERFKSGTVKADIVGPVCETGDFLARDREMPELEPGDLLAVCTSGAYGFVLASNYNSRLRPAEVLVNGREAVAIRERETYDDLVRGEKVG